MVAIRRVLARFSVCGVLVVGCCAAQASASPETPMVRGFAYGSHARQQVTAYWRQPAADPGPGLVLLHGGYWARDTDWSGWARTFAAQGFVVFDVDYRLNFEARWPAQRDDALAALAWVRRHAARFGVAPDRLVLLGSSAGGQIATGVGTYGAGARRIAGVVALSPVASPYRAWVDGGRGGASARQRTLRAEAVRLAGCEPVRSRAECWAVWRDMVVRNRASGADDAPMYLLHSSQDFVPAAHARDLAARERAAGMAADRVTVGIVPGDAHGAGLLRQSGVLDSVLSWLRAERLTVRTGQRTPPTPFCRARLGCGRRPSRGTTAG